MQVRAAVPHSAAVRLPRLKAAFLQQYSLSHVLRPLNSNGYYWRRFGTAYLYAPIVRAVRIGRASAEGALARTIVFGFLIATVFWIGVLGWQSANTSTEVQKQKCYETAESSGHKTEECRSLWERTTSDPVAFFTLWLVIFTAGLTISTVMLWRAGEKQSLHTRRSAAIQTRDMQDSIAVAAKAADAAMLSARAAIALQLPVFRITPDNLGWGDTKMEIATFVRIATSTESGFRTLGQRRPTQ